jgi:hypothetical protein
VTDAPAGSGAAPVAADRGADRLWRVRHLPLLLGVSAAVVVLAAVVGAVTGGAVAALGAAIGVAIVTASYTVTTVMLAWADAVDPKLILPFGLTLYVTKYTLLGVVMVAVAASGWPGLVPLCMGVAVGVVAWTGAHIWWITTVHAARMSSAPPD